MRLLEVTMRLWVKFNRLGLLTFRVDRDVSGRVTNCYGSRLWQIFIISNVASALYLHIHTSRILKARPTFNACQSPAEKQSRSSCRMGKICREVRCSFGFLLMPWTNHKMPGFTTPIATVTIYMNIDMSSSQSLFWNSSLNSTSMRKPVLYAF